jgi:hypothetical protein
VQNLNPLILPTLAKIGSSFFKKGKRMASFTIWHWLVIFFIIAIPAVLIVAVLWWAMRMSKKPSTSPVTVESRLEELFRLRSKDLISLAEYEQQRAAILNNI